MRFVDLTGLTFGGLKVVGISHRKRERIHWNCLCSCGRKIIVLGDNLKRKSSKGMCRDCYVKNVLKNGVNTTHRMTKTRFYKIWSAMKNRSTNSNYTYSKDYLDRGITLCPEWYTFKNFKKDMFTNYVKHCKKYGEKNTSIERVDNNSGYNKENCIWATRAVQRRNTRNSVYIEFKGKRKILGDWAKELGLSSGDILSRRINKLGWSLEKSLTTKNTKTNVINKRNKIK